MFSGHSQSTDFADPTVTSHFREDGFAYVFPLAKMVYDMSKSKLPFDIWAQTDYYNDLVRQARSVLARKSSATDIDRYVTFEPEWSTPDKVFRLCISLTPAGVEWVRAGFPVSAPRRNYLTTGWTVVTNWVTSLYAQINRAL